MKDDRILSKNDVVQASHIVVKPGCKPTRVVIRKIMAQGVIREFVVHDEYLSSAEPNGNDSCRFVHVGFEQGDYIRIHGFDTNGAWEKAVSRWQERVSKLFR